MILARVEVVKNTNSAMASNFKLILIISIISISGVLSAQSVRVQESNAVSNMLSHYKNYYGKYPEIRGHRIQVLSTTDRREMDKTLQKLNNSYSGLYVDWKHTAPYYRVIVGAYLTPWDAETALYAFRKDFSGSVIIYDNIPKEQFLKTR